MSFTKCAFSYMGSHFKDRSDQNNTATKMCIESRIPSSTNFTVLVNMNSHFTLERDDLVFYR